jgi:small subunit ribosomal protein S6
MTMATATIDARTSNYEAMILIGQGAAAQLPEILTLIRQNIERQGGRIIAMKKWDERRLAYEIDKQKRALYILCYFSAPNAAMGQIERNFNLSEQIMRVLITKADHLSEDEMRAADAMKDLEAEAKLRASQPNMVPANITAPPTVDPNVEDED